MTDVVICRVMRPEELPVVLDWAASEGWNPGLDDAQGFYPADPEGFFVAEAEGKTGNQIVAAISVVNHSDSFAFLGLYLCLPDWRGRGIGFALWNFASAHAGTRTIGLDGVLEQQDNYRVSGFEFAGQTVRWQGVPMLEADPMGRAATSADLDAMVALEARASGVAKPAYLRNWFENTAHRMSFVDGTEGISGLMTVRECRVGAKIGPLIAENEAQARGLLAQALLWARERGCTEVVLDVPTSAVEMTGLARSMGLVPGFETARMYRGPGPAPATGWFAVATLELG